MRKLTWQKRSNNGHKWKFNIYIHRDQIQVQKSEIRNNCVFDTAVTLMATNTALSMRTRKTTHYQSSTPTTRNHNQGCFSSVNTWQTYIVLLIRNIAKSKNKLERNPLFPLCYIYRHSKNECETTERAQDSHNHRM